MSFKKYKEEYLQGSSDEAPHDSRKKSGRSREPLRGQFTNSYEYYKQLRNQKAHQEQYFGEVSYFKPTDIVKNKSKIYQDADYIYQ